MGGGEAGAGRCERCGQEGPVRKVGGMMYLCARCRHVYEIEDARRRAALNKDNPQGKTEKK